MELISSMSKNYNNENPLNTVQFMEDEMEKIRSGQTFLYREGGCPSMVVDIRMKEDIALNYLRQALDQALLRYPYLTSKMLEKDGNFYLVKNPLPFLLEETETLHSLGSAEVNYHLADITYYGKTIYVSYHHGLCDGRGIMPFINTLVYYYCTLKYNTIRSVLGVRLAGEPLLPCETAEPFEESLELKDTHIPEIYKDGYALPDSINSLGKNKYYRYEIKIVHKDFIQFCKANNATPAITIALLASKAIQNIHPETDKPILCNLASDLRKGINMENTFKNCVGSVCLPYTDKLISLPFQKQAAAYRKIIEEHKKTDNLKREINKQIYLFDKLDELPTYEAKKNMLSFFDNLITNTFILSYVGQSKLGGCEKYIDSFHTYISGTTGLSLQMLSVGEYFTINFMQSFETDKYINSFMAVMEEAGFPFSVSDIIEYTTPKDSLHFEK